MIINLVFPKAGIKFGSLPITAGYLLVLLTLFASTSSFLKYISKEKIYLFLCWIPFQVFILFHSINFSPLDPSYFFSFLLNFVFFPWTFLLIFLNSVSALELNKLVNVIRLSLLFVSAFGIFSFFYKVIIGDFLEIPGLTVNWDDCGKLGTEKFIDRGGVFKLISTYGNGNLYGICLLFFYPLYLFIEPSKINRSIVRYSLILTLSRTVWIGLIFVESIHLMMNFKLSKIISLAFTVMLILFCNQLLLIHQSTNQFFLDSNLGGRAEQFDCLTRISLFGNGGFDGIYEMVYLGIIKNFGFLGFIFFLIAFLSPLFFYFYQGLFSPIKNQIILGLMTYFLLCFSDGAILLIPVMLFYFLSVILIFLLPQSLPEPIDCFRMDIKPIL